MHKNWNVENHKKIIVYGQTELELHFCKFWFIENCEIDIRLNFLLSKVFIFLAGRGRRENGKYFVVATQGDKTAEREELNMIREAMMNRAIEMLRERFRRKPRECLDKILNMQKQAKTERDLAAKNKEGVVVRQGQYVLR